LFWKPQNVVFATLQALCCVFNTLYRVQRYKKLSTPKTLERLK